MERNYAYNIVNHISFVGLLSKKLENYCFLQKNPQCKEINVDSNSISTVICFMSYCHIALLCIFRKEILAF